MERKEEEGEEKKVKRNEGETGSEWSSKGKKRKSVDNTMRKVALKLSFHGKFCWQELLLYGFCPPRFITALFWLLQILSSLCAGWL